MLVCLVLAGCAVCSGQTAASLNLEPGASTQQTFGAATLLIHVAQQKAEVEVAVELGGRIVVERTLAPAHNVLTLDQRIAETGIRGSIIASFGYPQQQSVLSGSFAVTQFDNGLKTATAVTTPYKVELATWQWPIPVVREHWLVWITPEISAEVDLMLDVQQSLQIRLGTVSQTILAATVAEGSNDVQYKAGYAIATVTIAPGLHFHLQPSTPMQQGNLLMEGIFSSSGHPEVKYDAGLVSWSYLPPPPGRESAP